MVLILDGNSDHVAQRKQVYFVTALRKCASISELPWNIRTELQPKSNGLDNVQSQYKTGLLLGSEYRRAGYRAVIYRASLWLYL